MQAREFTLAIFIVYLYELKPEDVEQKEQEIIGNIKFNV